MVREEKSSSREARARILNGFQLGGGVGCFLNKKKIVETLGYFSNKKNNERWISNKNNNREVEKAFGGEVKRTTPL